MAKHRVPYRRAVEDLVRRRRREREAVDRYVAAYVAAPETPGDQWVDLAGRKRLEQEPWDEAGVG